MTIRTSVALAATALAAVTSAFHIPAKRQSSNMSNIDAFVSNELPMAFNYALGNIGGTNYTTVPEADPGIVVASPSKVNPNYFYTWTRDSALTFAMIVDEYYFGNTSLQKTISEYQSAQAFIQTVTNPSGSLWPAGEGLGEMKFFVNKTRFNEDWGRPQRDGPALRSTVFLKLANLMMEAGDYNYVKYVMWPLIYPDIAYVGQYWNQTGYELWEEVHGTSFFTLNAQHRSLVMAGLLAAQINETCEPCMQQAQIACLLPHFWNSTGGYITADLNTNQITTRSGINVSPLISSIQVFDPAANATSPDFQPSNSYMLATHKVVVDAFRDLYPINNNATAPNAVAVGRYPEDTYQMGNPWYLCTLACAEFLYDAVYQFNQSNSLTIDEISLSFFQDIYPNASMQTYTGSSMTPILEAMTNYGDGFMGVIQTYISPNGSMDEQFNKTTGVPTSARDLTWSLASFVTAARRRGGYVPASWGAMNATTPASTCNGTSYNSYQEYMPAYAAGAPTVDLGCYSQVTFRAYIDNNNTNPYLLGNTSYLGNALNVSAISQLLLPMNPGLLNSTDNEWFVDIWLPAGIPVNYTYVMNLNDEILYYQNSSYMVYPAVCGGDAVGTEDSPSFPGGVVNGTSMNGMIYNASAPTNSTMKRLFF